MALLIYAMRYQNLVSVVPLAREYVIESMEDAFIVCNKEFNFLDANARAKKLFPALDNLVPGDEISGSEAYQGVTAFSVPVGDEVRFFKITRTEILQNNRAQGMCFVLHDTTENEKLMTKLRVQAEYDPLMGIYNRGALFEISQKMLNTEISREYSYAMLMMDIDFFKQINDTYGHSTGDFVLKEVAATIKRSFRESDIIGRYGGEEIVVLLENITAEKAFALAEGLREKIERTPITYLDNEIYITISIGIAVSSAGEAHSLEMLLHQADEAMYRAKNSGRNKTIA